MNAARPEAPVGLGAVPGRQAEFQSGFDLTLDYARKIGASAIHCMARQLGSGDRQDAESVLSKFARRIRQSADENITLLIEPIRYH